MNDKTKMANPKYKAEQETKFKALEAEHKAQGDAQYKVSHKDGNKTAKIWEGIK